LLLTNLVRQGLSSTESAIKYPQLYNSADFTNLAALQIWRLLAQSEKLRNWESST